MSRRDFGWLTAGCMLALGGCVDDGDVVQTGPIGDDDDPGPGAPDAGEAADAASSAATCAGGEVDAGAPSGFATGAPVRVAGSNIFIVRDATGLFAVSSLCPHRNAQNNVTSGHFHCPKHNANFQFDGTIISGPVNQPLAHFAVCILTNGHVGVNPSVRVAATERLDA